MDMDAVEESPNYETEDVPHEIQPAQGQSSQLELQEHVVLVTTNGSKGAPGMCHNTFTVVSLTAQSSVTSLRSKEAVHAKIARDLSNEVIYTVLINAACKLKEDYKQVVKLCTKVLEIKSNNVKALYRTAQAYINLVDLDLAEPDIKKHGIVQPIDMFVFLLVVIRDVNLELKVFEGEDERIQRWWNR
ncbi:peptidyl-prolyl cis-trans isomerase FKBP62 [Artemisia annua]|uniref:Peptidyl-prolyl cis-trans isomerase FKBP62 n=1 Tax=Artemisia annua TaxID=35608 RepID=A0A2U1M814_ARTAN|nr:peptidyl-prolyl cis-trans isomerase FKBP62 [Artemisia annua]